MTASSGTGVEVGFASAAITPSTALPLAGFEVERKGNAVRDELFVRALVVRSGTVTLVLLVLDVLYVSRSFCRRVEAWAAQTHGITREHIFIAATHTHCAPSITNTYFSGTPVVAEYLERVVQQSCAAITQAMADPSAAGIRAGAAHSAHSINRRSRRWDTAALRRLRLRRETLNRPNPRGPVDNTVRCLWFGREDEPEIFVVAAGCHPSLVRTGHYSADFPGAIERHLQEMLGRAVVVLFVQGFSGDTRARLVETAPFAVWPPGALVEYALDHTRFRKDSDAADVERTASMIADAARITPLRPVHPALSGSVREIRLPLEARPDRTRLGHAAAHGGSDRERHSAAHALATWSDTQDVSFEVRTWNVGQGVGLVGLEGEIFSEYAAHICARAPAGGLAIPVSCVGGMLGYVPTAASLAAGGYEVDRSRSLFGLPSRLAPASERVILEAVGDLMANP